MNYSYNVAVVMNYRYIVAAVMNYRYIVAAVMNYCYIVVAVMTYDDTGPLLQCCYCDDKDLLQTMLLM